MSTLLDAPPAAVTGGADDDLRHVVCCDDETALCGMDVSGQPWVDDSEETTCPMCAFAEAKGWGCSAPDCPVA